MRRAYIGIYWTRPVPWVGFNTLSPDADIAVRQSRTICYQREVVRRYVREAGGVLEHEVALLELAPDRATPESATELARVVAGAAPEAIFISVEFSENRGWRPHPFLRDGLPLGRTLALPPEPILIEGQIFDPIQHFRGWRALEKAHSAGKAGHRAAILAALEGLPEGWSSRAAALNAAGYRTNGGKGWTADNLRKFAGQRTRGRR